ncbi:MAG TPA: hypothetical protein VJC07_01960 [Candidatus Nanoarchaeia archaeon]|nr:hypothetical protein [Candidatus Nanoarchaeia archaeon]
MTFADIVFDRFLEILRAPYTYSDMLWSLAPVVAALLLIELYFGRYKHEELGWNTAFGNTLVLLFVSIDLFRRLYTTGTLHPENPKLMIAAIVAVFGILLSFIDFFHLLPKRLAWDVSSKTPMNFLACIAVILVYAEIPLDRITFFASLILGILVAAILKSMQIFIPEAEE